MKSILKKWISFILALLVLLEMFPLSVFAENKGWLESIEFKNADEGGKAFEIEGGFPKENIGNYIVYVPDCDGPTLFVFPTLTEAAKNAGVEIDIKYTNLISSAEVTFDYLDNFFQLIQAIKKGSTGNKVTLTMSLNEETEVYIFDIVRTPTLKAKGLSLKDGNGNEVVFEESFGPYKYEYTAKTTSSFVTVTAEAYNSAYTVKINGSDDNKIALSEGENTISVSVTDENNKEKVYFIAVERVSSADTEFDVTPSDAAVYVTDSENKRILPNTSGKYELIPNGEYSYSVTKFGYKAKKDTFTADGENITVALEAAPKSVLKVLPSAWPSFGFNSKNNIVIDYPTPTTKAGASLYWATKLGNGYDSGAAGVPIIVDDYIYNYAGKKLYKIDKISGKIVAEGTMDHSSSFAINSPTYAEGMLFVGLSNGCIQAFNADTLESLWIYHDPLKGQPNSTIEYNDGYIYTGFWKGETEEANFVCLSVTDEDTGNDKEEKTPSWRYAVKGGYYWAGAYVNDEYAIVGTDDGDLGYTANTASILVFDKKTGIVVDEMSGFSGDIRSSISYDSESNRIYFTSKGGYLYSVKVDEHGKISDKSQISLGGMSTSTPTIYKGRAYVGVSGSGQFVQYSGHRIAIIDLAAKEVVYTVETQGYPQTTATLTTYYESDDGFVYFYFFDNFTPGKLRVVKDKAGVTERLMTDKEIEINGKNTIEHTVAHAVFTPTGELAEYCICTPVIDSDGTLYFKNDSAYLMALGAAVDHIEVTENPSKMSYKDGETFDPNGMKVTAFYVNGTKRDITDYVTYSTEPLKKGEEEFEIRFEHVNTSKIPTAVLVLTIGGNGIELKPVEDEDEGEKIITLSSTIKFTELEDNVTVVNKPSGGVFYVGIKSNEKLKDLNIETDGMLKGEILDYDAQKYRTTGIGNYSVYNSKNPNEEISKASGYKLYDLAKKRADDLNKTNKTTVYKVKNEDIDYVAKITVPQNYTVNYKIGTYRLTAMLGKTELKSAKYTVVSDVDIFEYEYLKYCAENDEPLFVNSNLAVGYSDYLTAKNGYSITPRYDPENMPVLPDKYPTVVSRTEFRAVQGKKLELVCSEDVKITIPEVAGNQMGVNFMNSLKNNATSNPDEEEEEDKKDIKEDAKSKSKNISLAFYGKQQIMSDFTIEWNINKNAFDLLNSFGIKLEENDVITYYITKDGYYFDEFTVDYANDDIYENIELTFENTEGDILGTYRLTDTKPAERASANEENPNTGAL